MILSTYVLKKAFANISYFELTATDTVGWFEKLYIFLWI